MIITEINQSKISPECWSVQFLGLTACRTCELLGKKDCGGKVIRKTGKNRLGIVVPLGTITKKFK